MKVIRKIRPHVPMIFTISKYAFSVLLTFYAYFSAGKKHCLVIGFIELAIIFVLSNILMKKKKIGNIVNDILVLLYNAQMVVLGFGSSYITMVMLSNIPSLKALSGRTGTYITAVILVLFFTCIPIKRLELKKTSWFCPLSVLLCLELAFTLFFGNAYSPLYAYFALGIQQYERMELIKEINNAEYVEQGFTNSEVVDCYERDEVFVENPNIILIFTEGLSQHVIEDERNLMPNVRDYQSRSLSFVNYFNHTFATYRGLSGQLYSGHQMNEMDENPLVSLQDILADEGYNTFFINTEPNNKDFTKYLESFEFDNLISDKLMAENGIADSVSDKDAYEALYELAVKQSEEEEPFFISIYTFGTHASLDSPDEKFGNGKDAELNKFYNLDYQFGEFMEKFNVSDLKNDTIIIFTSDHATYQDDAFNRAFPDYNRFVTTVDAIPLFFYYDGIEQAVIDVAGRNSINLTPTILDYLDYSAPNYFLGTSLFSSVTGSVFETTFTDSNVVNTTRGGSVGIISEEENNQFREAVKDYYIIKNNH